MATKTTVKDLEARMNKIEGLLEKLVQAQASASTVNVSKKTKRSTSGIEDLNKRSFVQRQDSTVEVPPTKKVKRLKNGYAAATADFEIPWAGLLKEGKTYYLNFTSYVGGNGKKDLFPAIGQKIKACSPSTRWIKNKGYEFNSKQAAEKARSACKVVTKDERNKIREQW